MEKFIPSPPLCFKYVIANFYLAENSEKGSKEIRASPWQENDGDRIKYSKTIQSFYRKKVGNCR